MKHTLNRKKVISFTASLLAVLTLLPAGTVGAGISTATTAKDSAVYWTEGGLPTDGDRSYKSDSKWYRIVLEYDSYTTDSVDSNGDYADISAGTSSSWPERKWNYYFHGKALAYAVNECNNDLDKAYEFSGVNKVEEVTTGTAVLTEDASLYKNNEYSQDGMYSLYIKYAGKSEKTNEDCWYISPCDSNGDREKKLWALDCCLNLCSDEAGSTSVYSSTNCYDLICKGFTPEFSLLTPTFEEFETLDNFKKAGVATPLVWTKGEINKSGSVLGDYYDNNKWIIRQGSDGTWSVKSAGYIDWDWTDTESGFTDLFDDPAEALAEGIAHYALTTAWELAEAAGDSGETRATKRDEDTDSYRWFKYHDLFVKNIDPNTTDSGHPNTVQAMPYVGMLFLTEYAENVYITGDYFIRKTALHNADPDRTGKGDFVFGEKSVSLSEETSITVYDETLEGTSAGGLHTSYFMTMSNSITLAQIRDQNQRTQNDYETEGEDYSFNPAWFLQIWSYSVSGNGTYTYLTVDQIKNSSTMPLKVTSDWTPEKGSGAFTGLYVGTTLKTEVYDADNASITVGSGVTAVLGSGDKNSDNINDGAAYIGTLYEKGGKSLSSYSIPKITVEEGGTLQIDGPVYAALGTEITVKGSLIINAGASLNVEDLDYSKSGVASGYFGISLTVDGGSVYISAGSILDVGTGAVELKNGGSIVNNGVFIQSAIARMDIAGGSVENGSKAWFIQGAEVKGKMRRTLLKAASGTQELGGIASLLYGTDDSMLKAYEAISNYAAKYGFTSDDKADLAMLRFQKSETDNMFRNYGSAYIDAAIKGKNYKESENAGFFLGGGKLYRGLDFYNIINGSENTSVCSTENLQKHTVLSPEGNLEPDALLKDYYDLTGIKYSGSSVIENDEGETRAEKSNVFILKVGTGSQGTGNISCFKVNYISEDGARYTETISPSSLDKSYEFVSSWQYCGTDESQAGDSKLKLSDGSPLSSGSIAGTLEETSNVCYVFQTMFPLAYVESIEFLGAGSGSWTCMQLDVYRVSYLYPLEEYGWKSEDWYIPFTGTLIAETAIGSDSNGIRGMVFNWDSETIEIGTGLYGLNVYGVPDSVKSKTDTSGFTYYNASTGTVPYSTSDAEYTFEITLADTNNAGIENFYFNASNFTLEKYMSDAAYKSNLGDKSKIDMLLTYYDTNGCARRITLPFTGSALEWAYSSMDDESKTAPLHGLFQQGEKIVFRGNLPDFASATEAALTYTDNSEGDSIAVSAITISKPSYTDVSVSDGMLRVEYPETAVAFYCAPTTDGVPVVNGQLMSISLKAWNGTESLAPKSSGSKFLVVIQTDTMSEAATINDIVASFTYKNLNGLTSATKEYSLKDLAEKYYGYWLTSDGKNADCAYRTAVTSGQQLYFVLDIENLYSFESATFTMPSTNADEGTAAEGDEWQMKSITIYELEEMGTREVIMGKGISLSDISTNRTYYRDNIYGSRGVINSASGLLMIGPGQSKTIEFSNGDVTGGGENISKNKATGVKSLTYEETKQDFGFNSKRYRYTVKVKVAGDSITSAEDGDCGSQNQFYFQLVFEDEEGELHTSPCVLSNQQLQSDGFRTGTIEEFEIYTNDDYGTPVQVNIIPDDTSSTSDVFDKLNIEYISVSKVSSTGVTLGWKADDVGWIDIEYRDDAEEQDGRTEQELIRSFDLRDDGYKVMVEFAIETAADYVDDSQFTGQVVADITYRTTGGVLTTEYNVDVVSKIAAYCERTGDLPDTPVSGTQVSVPEFMFTKGYTNRFQYLFDDISSLVKIKFKITPEEDVTWKLDRVSARQVFNEGTLSFNIFNEYERYYSIDPQDLTVTSNTKAISITANAGEQTIVTLNFNSGNTISIDTSGEEEQVDVEEGESEGVNDVISLTAELTDVTGITAGTSLPVKIIYKNIYGDAYSVSATLVFDETSGKFMVPQDSLPKTPDIGVPYEIEITGSDVLSGRQLEIVTVNQIRDRQVVEQFKFVPDAGTKLEAGSPVTILLSESQQDEYAKKKGYTTETQMLYMLLGEKTEKILLTDTQDLSVALVYIEKNDPYNYEHVSDYVSALDCGYTIISSGTVLSLPMNVSNIGAVKSVILKTGDEGMKVNVKKACISLEEKSNITSSRLASGWVNLPAETAEIDTGGTAMSTDGGSLAQALASTARISPLNIAANITKTGRSDAMLRVTVYYQDTQSVQQSVTYEMQANDWNRDSVWILTEGLKTVQYYKVEVYDKDGTNTAYLTADSFTVSWYGTDGVYTSAGYNGEMSLTEGTALSASVLNTQLNGTVRTADGTTVARLEENHASDDRKDYTTVTLQGSGDITVSATLTGFPGELEMYVLGSDGKKFGETVSATAVQETLAYTFQLPLNTGDEAEEYVLYVVSKNIPGQYKAAVNILVEPAVYIQGTLVGPGAAYTKDIFATSTGAAESVTGLPLKPEEEITIYVKAFNAGTAGIKWETSPGTLFTVTSADVEAENDVFAGYKKFIIKAAENIENAAQCTFTLSLEGYTGVSYQLNFAVSPS